MKEEVKELEKAYAKLDEAREHLYKAGFNILAYEVQELYEEIEEILDIIYEAREEKE